MPADLSNLIASLKRSALERCRERVIVASEGVEKRAPPPEYPGYSNPPPRVGSTLKRHYGLA